MIFSILELFKNKFNKFSILPFSNNFRWITFENASWIEFEKIEVQKAEISKFLNFSEIFEIIELIELILLFSKFNVSGSNL